MKKVKYDYIPPFGTDIKILEVMSKNASRKLHNALGKVGTIKKLGGGAQFMNLINNSKNDKVAHGASGTYDILPKTQYVDTFFAGHEESKFTNGTTRQRSPWNSSRKHVDAIRHAAGVDPKTGEFVPIYNVKETTFTDGATHQRTPWSTTKKHFTFDKNLQKHYEKGHLGSMDFNDLKLLKQLTLEIEEIGKKPEKLK